MSQILSLWLPALVSAVAVFILSSIIHMALPWWHRSDYRALPNEDAVLDALRPMAIPPGEYMAPRPASSEDMRSAGFQEKMNRGPNFQINIMRPGPISMGRPLALWFVYVLVVAFAAGHVALGALGDHNDPPDIFHAVALSAFMGFAFALWQSVIWFQRPAKTALKATVDGLLYALVTALVYVWLWPA
ncbi:MAG TPA: hypothetical protein VFO55_01570 [Gemmatimonadaceae bacterium]|nr:hypothetical protein [Gemmatimonadaceae bacterium]